MPRGEGAGAPRSEMVALSPRGGHLGPVARRYYPLGIAAAFLGTLVAFFPSTVPLGVGGSLFFAGGSGTSGRPTATKPFWPPRLPAASLQSPGLVAGPGAGETGAAVPFGTGGTGWGSASVPPSAGASSGGNAPTASCPVPLPPSGSPIGAITEEVSALCATLTGSRGASEAGPNLFRFGIPGTAFPAPPAAGAVGAELGAWVALDVPATAPAAVDAVGADARGTPASAHPTAVLGLVQGATVPGRFDTAARGLRRDGAAVVLLLVPDSGAPGGAQAFAAWVSRTVRALPDAGLVAVGVGGPGPERGPPAVAADALAGLTAAEGAAAAGQHAGLWWGDGGVTAADASEWRALVPSAGSVPPALRAGTFIGATFGASGAAASPCATTADVDALRTEASSVLAQAAPPVVAELVAEPFPSAGVPTPTVAHPSEGGCGTFAPRTPGLAGLFWRLGAGPTGPAGSPRS